MPNLIGTGLNQAPTNSMLGGLAYQSPDYASIKNLDLRNIAEINAETADTAVDVFVYDTSKDSDGGAWRQRTSHTSWYNETLNTATRGSRREFPAVAVLVLEAGKLTIYDGDDPDLPMWMVFNNTGSNLSIFGRSLSTKTSVEMLNGLLVIGGSYSSPHFEAFTHINFISEKCQQVNTTGTVVFNKNISQRGETATYNFDVNSFTLVNIVSVNDVAMTVLPNAPIDSATGLPIPTIAVATNGGVSVIKDDGTVVDYTYQVTTNTNANNVYLSETGRLQYSSRSISSGYAYYVEYDNLSSSDVTSAPNVVLCVSETGGSGVTRILPKGAITSDAITKDYTATGYNPSSYTDYQGGLFLHKTTGDVKETDGISLPNSNFMGLHIRPDCNTGWMHGDIKGAFLSDTTAESFSATNLVSEDFSANWTGATGGVLSVSSGQLTITNSGSNGRAQSNTFATTSGKKYAFIVKAVSNSSATYRLEVRGPELVTTGITDGQTLVVYFNGTGNSSTYVELYAIGSSGSSATYEDAYVVEIEEDRSVNNKGLQVFGTITKTPVATGADLVAYHGVSATNYLRQPYNSDLNFGTGDFSIFVWVLKNNLSSNHYIIDRALVGPFSQSGRTYFIISLNGYHRFKLAGGSEVTGNVRAMPEGVYNHIGFVRRSGTMEFWMNGDLVQTVTGSDASASFDDGVTGQTMTVDRYANGFGSDYTFDRMALLRISGSVPSPEQIKKMYEDEKVLFQENAACTLYGSSDAVTALAYDTATESLHVGTSSGRSEFKGLRRIGNTTTAVTTAISASNGLIAEQ